MCSKFNFITIFLILANFAAFLDHTKENADVSKTDGYFRLISTFTESTCLRLLAHQIWSLYLLPVKSYVGGGGAFLHSPTKIGLSNSPTTIGLIQADKIERKSRRKR